MGLGSRCRVRVGMRVTHLGFDNGDGVEAILEALHEATTHDHEMIRGVEGKGRGPPTPLDPWASNRVR